VTWTASYANTTDTFGTIGTATKTQIATGTFTVNSTLTRYTTNIYVPAAATTGIEILFTVGAQTSGTWQIGNVQFEAGSIATPFERPIYSNQLEQCQRYFYIIRGSTSGADAMRWNSGYAFSTTQAEFIFQHPVDMRAAPTLLNSAVSTIAQIINATTFPPPTSINSYQASVRNILVYTGTSGLTQNMCLGIGNISTSTTSYLSFSAEL
jgi:hypothetical protein